MTHKNTFTRFVIIFTIFSILLIAFLIIAHEQMASTALLLKIISIYIILLTACSLWIIAIAYRHLSEFGQAHRDKQESSERLLLDLRDGTKQYQKEKRKSVRIKSEITAQLKTENVCDYIKTIDLSYDGALLKTVRTFQVGDTIGLDLYLPLFPKPIHINVLVVRVIPNEKDGKTPTYQIGVKYLQMSKEIRRRLVETLDTLSKGKQIKL